MDATVEGLREPIERIGAAGPLVERGRLDERSLATKSRAWSSWTSSPYTAPSRRGASIGAASAMAPMSTGVKPASSMSPLTMRLASSSSPHRNMTTRSGPARPAASAWKPEVSVLKAFV